MRRRWKILLFGLCGVIAVGAVCFFCLREKEPSYNGRTLSEWLEQCEELESQPIGDIERWDNAVAAVRAIGTNGLPFLTAWSQKEQSPGQFVLEQHLPNRLKFKWAENWIGGDVSHKNLMAEIGFKILGTNALPALPQIEEHFMATTNRVPLMTDAYCIAYMGTPSFDFALRVANTETNTHVFAAVVALREMSYLGTNAASAVPVLLRLMRNTNDARTARVAAMAAGKLGLMCEKVLPGLTNLYTSPDWLTRQFVVLAIGDLGKHTMVPQSFLQETLRDPNERVRWFATNTVREIAPDIITKSNAGQLGQ